MLDFTDRIDKVVRSTFIRAQRVAYETLLHDIELHDYTTISEIKGSIQIDLDSLAKLEKKELKGESNE